jgi:transcriptional regulator with XRE-family HTH domain
MPKSLTRPEYRVFCALLRDTRLRAGISQESLARHMEKPQTFISGVERGQLRLDFLQIRDWCQCCGTSVSKLALLFERRLKRRRSQGAD